MEGEFLLKVSEWMHINEGLNCLFKIWSILTSFICSSFVHILLNLHVSAYSKNGPIFMSFCEFVAILKPAIYINDIMSKLVEKKSLV